MGSDLGGDPSWGTFNFQLIARTAGLFDPVYTSLVNDPYSEPSINKHFAMHAVHYTNAGPLTSLFRPQVKNSLDTRLLYIYSLRVITSKTFGVIYLSVDIWCRARSKFYRRTATGMKTHLIIRYTVI